MRGDHDGQRPEDSGFTTRRVAQLCNVTTREVLRYVRSGVLEPIRDGAGHWRFSFADVALLRSLRRLATQPGRRVHAAAKRLQARGRRASEVSWHGEGRDVIVRDGRGRFDPLSGQVVFEFEDPAGASVASLVERRVEHHDRSNRHDETDVLEQQAATLELHDTAQAIAIYRRLLLLRPGDRVAAINLGRLLHETGDVHEAARCYRDALTVDERDSVAWFNLGVALEDLGDDRQALGSYLRALDHDPGFADAHYNAARLYERSGDEVQALRHLRAYRDLVRVP